MRISRKWMALTGVVMAAVVLGVLALPAAADHVVAAPVLHRGGVGNGAGDEFLAEALGITVDDLQAARQAAYEAAVQQAVEAGLITQAQADALQARGRYDLLRMMGRFVGADDVIEREALLADALDVDVATLQRARQAAADAQLDQAVENGRITQEQADTMKARRALGAYLDQQGLRDSMRALLEDAVQGAVEAGVITQEQADAFLSNQARLDHFRGMRAPDGRRGMPGFRGHPGRDGMRDWEGMPRFGVPGDAGPSGLLQRGGARVNPVGL